MKTKILSFIAVIVLMLAMAACDSEWHPAVEKQGQVSLKSMGVDVSDQMNLIQHTSRGSYDISEYIVTIYNEAGEAVHQWAYKDMPEIMTLNVGKYSVNVKSHNVEKAAWNKPYFEGSKEFEVALSKITDIGVVTCKFSSLRVTIKFTDELRALMGDDVKVDVVANDEGRLEYTPATTESGYFEATEGSMTLVASFSGTVKGYFETVTNAFTDVAPGQHRIITYDVKNDNPDRPDEIGKIDPVGGININVGVKDEDVNNSVNNGEEHETPSDRPGNEVFPDDPENPDGPNPPTPPEEDTIEFVTDLAWAPDDNPVQEGKSYVVNIKAKDGVAHLLVKIESTNDKFIGSVEELMPLEFDLAYPGTYGEAFSSIGLKTGTEVIDQTEVPFNITGLVPLLASPNFSGTHSFTITVTDNKQKQLSKTLKFKS